MKNSKDLKQQTDALKIQKHQLFNANKKLSQINCETNSLINNQNKQDSILDNLLADMESLIEEYNLQDYIQNLDNNLQEENLIYEEFIYKDLDEGAIKQNTKKLDTLDNIVFNGRKSLKELEIEYKSYANRNNLNLNGHLFDGLLSKQEENAFKKLLIDECSYKNAKCDRYDYLIAGTCGLIGGLIDILFVGSPFDSKLGKLTDKTADNITKKFARICGWKGDNDNVKSAIGFLERKFKVNYDQRHTEDTNGKVKNLNTKNHHLKSMGHSPDIIGLFISILNQLTNTSTFINNGKVITIDTNTYELNGGNFIAKIFCGFINWISHIMSDWSGSSGSTDRGSGIPMPFYNLLELCNFGKFGNEKESFATIASKVFEKGYDLRHGLTMSIPVILTETLVRTMYIIKAKFYHKMKWSECKIHNTPELTKMLLISKGVLCLCDLTDATIRGRGNIILFLSRTNLIAWVDFANLVFKEIKAFVLKGKINKEELDRYYDDNLMKIL